MTKPSTARNTITNIAAGAAMLSLSALFTGVATNDAQAQTDLTDVQRRLQAVEQQFSAGGQGGLGGIGTDPTLDFSREVTNRQQRIFEEVARVINQQRVILEQMQTQIVDVLRLDYADDLESGAMTQDDIEIIAQQFVADYLSTRIQTSDNGLTTLPAQYEQRVRGCSLDGSVFVFRYNIALDFNALGNFNYEAVPAEQSLLERTISDTPDHFSGIHGMGQYMAALSDIHHTMSGNMTALGGRVVDSYLSEMINGDLYNASMNGIADNIETAIERRYGVDVDIVVEPARQVIGRCGSALAPPAPEEP